VNLDLDFLFHMFFLARYCKLLEENSFRGRTADFLFMLLFGATVLTTIVLLGGIIPYLSETFAKILFLSNSLTFMMVCCIGLLIQCSCFFDFCCSVLSSAFLCLVVYTL
jgi:Der1-like family